MHRVRVWLALLVCGCRIETVSPGATASSSPDALSGDVWIYTSVYRQVIDELEPLIRKAYPQLKVHWFQGGSEKISAKLDAELAAGGTPCDVLLTSDPYIYPRLKQNNQLLRYVSPNSLRTPQNYIDLDGYFAAVRLSTMVLVHSASLANPPHSFAELVQPAWKGNVALGDPLTSGTALTWAISMSHAQGADYFQRLRANQARIAGGNAAVLQKIEGGEAHVGVLLLENVLAAQAKGSLIVFEWPQDGAVVIPGYAAILRGTHHQAAAQAVLDILFSQEGQTIIAQMGFMHAVDPRVPGPHNVVGLNALMERSVPWNEQELLLGLETGAHIKNQFAQAFAQ